MSLWLKALKQCLINIILFSLSKSLFVLFFTNLLDCRIYETKFPTCHLPFFCLSYHFNFSFDARNLPQSCYHVTRLLLTAGVYMYRTTV